MANREIEHEGSEERPVRALTCFNILRAVLLYFLDLMLALVLLPRGTPVTLRNICIIFGKFLMHVAMLTVTYAFYLACISNENVTPHGPISLSINRMLGLPMDPNCRNRRGLEDSWDLLRVNTNSTLLTPSPASVSSSAPDLDLPDLDVNLTEAFVASTAAGEQDTSVTTTPLPQANSTFEVWSNLTTKAPDFFNDTVASTSRATSADKTRAVDLQSSTSGSTTSSSANVSIPEVSSAKPTAELTPPLVEDFSTSNLTLAVNEPGFNISSQDKDDKLIDEEYYVLLDKILGCLSTILMIFVMCLGTCVAGLGLVSWGERRAKRKANKTMSLQMRPLQQLHPSRDSAFEPASNALFRPIDRDTSSFAPIQSIEESDL